MKYVVPIATFLLCISPAGSSEINWRSMSKEQIDRLPREQMNGLPAFEVMTHMDANLGAAMKPMAAITLSKLFYGATVPVLPFEGYLPVAIREFQSDLGAAPDGVLKLGEFDELMKRGNKIDSAAHPIYPGWATSVWTNGNYAGFGGTWIIDGEQHAYPVNYTDYKCYRSANRCYLAEASLSELDSSSHLLVRTETMKVIKWDQSEILLEDEATCRVSTISVNLVSKDVVMITRNKGDACSDQEILPKLPAPRIARLVNGFDVISKAHKEALEATRKLWSKPMQQTWAAMMARVKAAEKSNSKPQ